MPGLSAVAEIETGSPAAAAPAVGDTRGIGAPLLFCFMKSRSADFTSSLGFCVGVLPMGLAFASEADDDELRAVHAPPASSAMGAAAAAAFARHVYSAAIFHSSALHAFYSASFSQFTIAIASRAALCAYAAVKIGAVEIGADDLATATYAYLLDTG